MENALQQPQGWGDDPLTDHFRKAYQNRLATYANKRDAFGRLVAIDACFERVRNGLINPKKPLSALLFLRTHAMFRSVCEHASGGQLPETFNIVRACLECAGYALHLAQTAGADKTWLNRHDDEEALRAAKSMFTVAAVRTTIASKNCKAAEVFDKLYQDAIDQGGHRNERSVTSNMRMEQTEGRIEMQQIYLHGDGVQLDYAMITATRTGVCALEILKEIFPERFELLGAGGEVLKLRQGL